MELSKRQEKILTSLIREYTKTAEPVGSLVLSKNYSLPWSSATVRAEMAALEAAGYIRQPHTSGGRIPTDKGFREYVNLMEDISKNPGRDSLAIEKVVKNQNNFDEAMRRAVWTLSELTKMLAIGSSPRTNYTHGLSNLMNEPEYNARPEATELARLVDQVDNLIDNLPNKSFGIFIGDEMPIGKSANCAMIVSRFKSPFSEQTSIAVIGPARLPYERVIPLVRRTAQIMEERYE